MSSQKPSSLKRICPSSPDPTNSALNSTNYDDSGIEVQSPFSENLSTPPRRGLKGQGSSSSTPLRSIFNFETTDQSACLAPKQRRMTIRFDRKDFEPKRLFEAEDEENCALKTSPTRRPISKEQLDRLLLAPKRPNRPEEAVNRTVRPVRLFHSIDQGYNSDVMEEGSERENNFSISPSKFSSWVYPRYQQQ